MIELYSDEETFMQEIFEQRKQLIEKLEKNNSENENICLYSKKIDSLNFHRVTYIPSYRMYSDGWQFDTLDRATFLETKDYLEARKVKPATVPTSLRTNPGSTDEPTYFKRPTFLSFEKLVGLLKEQTLSLVVTSFPSLEENVIQIFEEQDNLFS